MGWCCSCLRYCCCCCCKKDNSDSGNGKQQSPHRTGTGSSSEGRQPPRPSIDRQNRANGPQRTNGSPPTSSQPQNTKPSPPPVNPAVQTQTGETKTPPNPPPVKPASSQTQTDKHPASPTQSDDHQPKPAVKPPVQTQTDDHQPKSTVKPPVQTQTDDHQPKPTVKPPVQTQTDDRQHKPTMKPPVQTQTYDHQPKPTVKPPVQTQTDDRQHKPTMKPPVQTQTDDHQPKPTVKPPVETQTDDHQHKPTMKPPVQTQTYDHQPKPTVKPPVQTQTDGHQPKPTVKPPVQTQTDDHQKYFSPKPPAKPAVQIRNVEPSPQQSPVRVRARVPRKRALLCGVSYGEGNHRLEGPVNDVRMFKDLLIRTFMFREENIRVLTEEELDPNLPRKKVQDTERIPTKRNIQKSLRWLVDDCNSGDSLVFYFAGHGHQVQDEDGDEIDGMDESIFPCDFEEKGMILDDEINSTIVAPLTTGVKLHAIVDACHSGTILDLEHVYDSERKEWKYNIPLPIPGSNVKKSTKGGLAISISACGDDQEAHTGESKDKEKTGIMTKFLIDAIKADRNITYGRLLDNIQYNIEAFKQQGWLPILKSFRRPKILQKTQLSSSECFDVCNKVLEL